VGFSIDVLKVLKDNLDFEYTMDHVDSDFSYEGVFDMIGPGAGQWDVVFGDWTATEERSEKLYVSYPFKDVGLGLITKRQSETEKEPEINIVLAPFENGAVRVLAATLDRSVPFAVCTRSGVCDFGMPSPHW